MIQDMKVIVELYLKVMLKFFPILLKMVSWKGMREKLTKRFRFLLKRNPIPWSKPAALNVVVKRQHKILTPKGLPSLKCPTGKISRGRLPVVQR